MSRTSKSGAVPLRLGGCYRPGHVSLGGTSAALSENKINHYTRSLYDRVVNYSTYTELIQEC